jgi:hypothetical protein
MKGVLLVGAALVLFFLLFLGSNQQGYPDDYEGPCGRATPQSC